MKLAEIDDPLAPMAVVNYALAHNYKVMEFFYAEKATSPNILKMLTSCLKTARETKCMEVCLGRIESRYAFSDDTKNWRVSVFGFIQNK